jgi:hypothetical protein
MESQKVNGGKFSSEVSRTVRHERQKIDHVVSAGPRNIQNVADFVVTISWIAATFASRTQNDNTGAPRSAAAVEGAYRNCRLTRAVPLKPPITRVATLGNDLVKIATGKAARRPSSLYDPISRWRFRSSPASL